MQKLTVTVVAALLPTVASEAAAQARGNSPMAPAATIGPVTDDATFSLLGVSSLPDGNGGSLAHRNDVWLGATQSIGRIGRVRLAAIGSGNWRMRNGLRDRPSADGQVAIRARARVGAHRVWSAVSYGYGAFDGTPNAEVAVDDSPAHAAQSLIGAMRQITDTSVARRVDIGQFGRAEAGVLSRYAGIELTVGISYEHAVQRTTQTLEVAPKTVANMLAPRASATVADHAATLQTLAERDVTTGIASLGFETGNTSWLVSLTAPITTTMRGDALAPRPRAIPTVASVAVARPITEWLAFVGAAATNTATIGTSTVREEIRDNVRETREGRFAPVVALGVRLSRLPRGAGEGTPDGILSFETRTLGTVDALSIDQGAVTDVESDTLRVVLLVDAPRAESVDLMGDATAWTVTTMRRQPSGRWRAELKLPPGMHRLIVRTDGGKWVAPPGIPMGHDEFGSPVGMLHIRPRR